MALEDGRRTMRLVRFHAAEYHIDLHKTGVLGFSAGGHPVTDISTHFDKRGIPPSMRPTKKAAARILRGIFIQRIYGLD
jgi:acetyl esterase/lipase